MSERKEALLLGGFHSDGVREAVALELEATRPRLVGVKAKKSGSCSVLSKGPQMVLPLPGSRPVQFFAANGDAEKEQS